MTTPLTESENTPRTSRAPLTADKQTGKRWYVVQTKPGQEYRAAKELRNQSFGVYVAKTYRRQRMDGKRVHPVASLRFTSYIFVAFDPDLEEHGPISNTRGVAHLMCTHSGEPHPIPDRIIEALRGCADEELADCTKRSRPSEASKLRPGAQVRLKTSDLFRGRTGQVLAVERGVVHVLCGMMVLSPQEVDVEVVNLSGVTDIRRKIA